MHEWALAEAVMETAAKAAERDHFKRITEIRVRLGELQQIDPELFESALQQLLRQKGELLRHAQIELEVEPASFRCRVCRREWGFDEARLAPEEAEFVHFVPEVAHVYMRCPGCGSPDFEVIRGRDLWLASLRGVR